MKHIIVKNVETAEAFPQTGPRGNRFTIRPIVPAEAVAKCAANFVEVAPGESAYGYHYHEENEEVFFIVRGEAAVRTPDGEIRLKAGDAIAFPANPSGAHVVRNPSATETLVYLDFGTANRPDIVHFTGLEKDAGMVVSRSGEIIPFER